MEKNYRYSLRKTTTGLVSAAILGVTVIPLAGNTVFAEEGGDSAEATYHQVAQPPQYDVLKWKANTVSVIEQEIQSQLGSQEETKDYEIQWGDTVWGITQAYDLNMDSFVNVNNIENPDLIYAGDIVTLDVESELTGNNNVTNETNDVTDKIGIKESEEKASQNERDPEINDTDSGSTVEDTSRTDEEDDTEDVDQGNFGAVVDEPITPGDNEVVNPTPPVKDVDVINDKEEVIEDEVIESEDPVTEEVVDEDIVEDESPVEIPEDKDEVDGDIVDEDITDESPVDPEIPAEPEEPIEPEDKDSEETVEDIINRTVSRKSIIKHGVQYVEDNTIKKGEQLVVQQGVDGERTREYEQTLVNGTVESEVMISDEVTVEPVTQIVHIGSKIVNVERETVVQTIPFNTVRRATNSLREGQERVVQEGVPGRVELVYESQIINGEIQGEPVLVSETVVQDTQDRIVEYGTYTDTSDEEINWTINTELFNLETLKYVNAERERLGVPTLEYSSSLQQGTDVRVNELLEVGDLRVDGVPHARPDGSEWDTAFTYLPQGFFASGENLAMSMEYYVDTEAVISGERTLENVLAEMFYNQYANSPGHYNNMISRTHTHFTSQTGFVYNEEYRQVQMFNAQIFGADRTHHFQ